MPVTPSTSPTSCPYPRRPSLAPAASRPARRRPSGTDRTNGSEVDGRRRRGRCDDALPHDGEVTHDAAARHDDDGIDAEGLHVLARHLARAGHEVIVAA